jgi:RNA polymerase sigma-70 factor (ECF subfamily)
LDEDPELLRAFVAREAWAYEAAYRLYGRVLHAAAFGVLRAAQDAQDCVHDVLLRLWHRGDAYRTERGSLRAFLAVCVRNEALSRARKIENRDRIARTAAHRAAPVDISDAVVQRESVRAALRALSEKQRHSIELAYYDGMTHVQIAGELGEPVGTVKSRLSAALRRLRDVFNERETHDVGC